MPKTWDIEISFADDLDDLWADELWDLSVVLDESVASPETDGRWWILKPGMADRGMGIRLFDSKERLRQILEEFDDDCQSDGDGDGDGAAAPTDSTTIAISQLRHFVIQASSASLFRMVPNSNNIFRNTYHVLSCSTHEKSPWVAFLHARSINCKAIRFVTFDVDCDWQHGRLSDSFLDIVSPPSVLCSLWRSHPLFVHPYVGAVLVETLHPAGANRRR